MRRSKTNYVDSKESLSKILGSRKEYYLTKIERGINTLYQRRNIDEIEAFEDAFSDLIRIMSGLNNSREKSRKRDPRPELDFATYLEAKNHKMSDEEIKDWFKTSSWRQLSGYSGAYSRYHRK